ncbi:hypothetical protein [Tissierella praeacuta]|uniref:hypothetical protein n=1 Tax=Tissierella praeacuta TaxID=43131 RepID=UPI0028AFD6A7|nr:hypothetical protein [Tissierella praeacuta]
MKNIKEIVNKYRWCQGIKKYSNKHYFKDNSIYREIQCNKDVELAYMYMNNHLEAISEIYPLYRDDIIELEKTLARYEIAVNKVISFYEHSISNPFSYTAEELQQLVDNIYKYDKEIAKLNMRRMCQD